MTVIITTINWQGGSAKVQGLIFPSYYILLYSQTARGHQNILQVFSLESPYFLRRCSLNVSKSQITLYFGPPLIFGTCFKRSAISTSTPDVYALGWFFRSAPGEEAARNHCENRLGLLKKNAKVYSNIKTGAVAVMWKPKLVYLAFWMNL